MKVKTNPGPMWTSEERIEVIEELSRLLINALELAGNQRQTKDLARRIYYVTAQTPKWLDTNRSEILEDL